MDVGASVSPERRGRVIASHCPLVSRGPANKNDCKTSANSGAAHKRLLLPHRWGFSACGVRLEPRCPRRGGLLFPRDLSECCIHEGAGAGPCARCWQPPPPSTRGILSPWPEAGAAKTLCWRGHRGPGGGEPHGGCSFSPRRWLITTRDGEAPARYALSPWQVRPPDAHQTLPTSLVRGATTPWGQDPKGEPPPPANAQGM